MDPALYKAATQGCVRSLRQLVVKDVKILNSKTPQGNTALHVAALYGHPNFAREVLKVSEELLCQERRRRYPAALGGPEWQGEGGGADHKPRPRRGRRTSTPMTRCSRAP